MDEFAGTVPEVEADPDIQTTTEFVTDRWMKRRLDELVEYVRTYTTECVETELLEFARCMFDKTGLTDIPERMVEQYLTDRRLQ